MIIIIDTREKTPYIFQNSITKALPTGDYSIKGLEDQIIVERKTKSDCYGSLGQGRKRFEKEFIRMAEFDYAALVIECSLTDFLTPPEYSQMNPKSAINSLISWSIHYGVHVHFCDSREYSRAMTYQILRKYWRLKGDGE